MRLLRAVVRVVGWFVRTATRAMGIQSHGGVDPNAADYLYKPRPPEFRP